MQGVEVLAVVVGPLLARSLAHQLLQLGVAAQPRELDDVHLAQLVKVQKLVVDAVFQAVAAGGDQPGDGAGDAGRVKVLEHRDALVALLDVELVQKLVGGHRVADALLEVGVAQHRPLGGELGVLLQQRHEVGGERGVAAAGLGAHDALAGHIHQAQRLGGHDVHIDQDVVQHRQVRVLAAGHMGAVVLLACLVGGSVFFHRHRHTLLSVRQSARAGDSSRPARAGSKQTFLLCQTAQTLPCPVCQTLHILLYPGGTPPPKPQYTTLFAFCLYHRRHPPGIHDRPARTAKSG